MRESFKNKFAGFTKTIIVVVISVVLALVGLKVVYGAQARDEQTAREATVHLLRAVGCELGVPVVNGVRSPVLLRACWTDEGLQPPVYFDK